MPYVPVEIKETKKRRRYIHEYMCLLKAKHDLRPNKNFYETVLKICLVYQIVTVKYMLSIIKQVRTL